MNVLRLAVAASVVALLSACASGPKMADVQSSIPTLKQGQGRIYFYRSNSMVGAAMQPDVVLNGQVVGKSKPGGFFFVDQPPGAMQVSTSTEVEKKLTFTLAAGEVRYVKTTIGMGLLVGRVYPELVDKPVGEKEIQEMSYIGQPLK
ncbi:MAG TPA: DUF2846 domain-containing protein [Burkholderiaceae bacterium]|nr:DUF2846 domain-containing protein [Burkholderiaceae bacterium]